MLCLAEVHTEHVQFNEYRNVTRVKHLLVNLQYRKVQDINYTNDPYRIKVQDEIMIHHTTVGLLPNTDYAFRIRLIRVFGLRGDVVGESSPRIVRTQCLRTSCRHFLSNTFVKRKPVNSLFLAPDTPQILSITLLESLTTVEEQVVSLRFLLPEVLKNALTVRKLTDIFSSAKFPGDFWLH